jgi:hypothetical protein
MKRDINVSVNVKGYTSVNQIAKNASDTKSNECTNENKNKILSSEKNCEELRFPSL